MHTITLTPPSASHERTDRRDVRDAVLRRPGGISLLRIGCPGGVAPTVVRYPSVTDAGATTEYRLLTNSPLRLEYALVSE